MLENWDLYFVVKTSPCDKDSGERSRAQSPSFWIRYRAFGSTEIQCLTQNQEVAGLSLTGGTALCP